MVMSHGAEGWGQGDIILQRLGHLPEGVVGGQGSNSTRGELRRNTALGTVNLI